MKTEVYGPICGEQGAATTAYTFFGVLRGLAKLYTYSTTDKYTEFMDALAKSCGKTFAGTVAKEANGKGETYRNHTNHSITLDPTPQQLQKITKLTKMDMMLYNLVASQVSKRVAVPMGPSTNEDLGIRRPLPGIPSTHQAVPQMPVKEDPRSLAEASTLQSHQAAPVPSNATSTLVTAVWSGSNGSGLDELKEFVATAQKKLPAASWNIVVYDLLGNLGPQEVAAIKRYCHVTYKLFKPPPGFALGVDSVGNSAWKPLLIQAELAL